MKTSRFLSLVLLMSLFPLLTWAQQTTNVSVRGTPGSAVTVNGQSMVIPADGVLAVQLPVGGSIASEGSISFELANGAVVEMDAGSTVVVNGVDSVTVTEGSAVVDTTAAPGASVSAASSGGSTVRVRSVTGTSVASNGAAVSVAANGNQVVTSGSVSFTSEAGQTVILDQGDSSVQVGDESSFGFEVEIPDVVEASVDNIDDEIISSEEASDPGPVVGSPL